MQGFVPRVEIPRPYRKGLHRLFQTGIAMPFYYTDEVVAEGTPMKLVSGTPNLMRKCVKGATEGAKAVGFAAQFTYDDSAWGELKNYRFPNHTGQRLDGSPILLLGGNGYILTSNYAGTPGYNEQLYVGASGLLEGTAGGAAIGDKLPAVSEGVDPDHEVNDGGKPYIRVRYGFPVVA